MTTPITAHDLTAMLARVAPHACDDPTLPAINGIRLETGAGYLFAVATDRYTLAVARTAVLAEDGQWTAHIRRADLPLLQTWLKRLGSDMVRILGVNGSEGEGVSFTSENGRDSLTLPSRNPKDYTVFPKWRQLLKGILQRDMQPVPVTGFNGKFLARWEAAGTELVAWQASPRSPLVLAGKDFIGMQMPLHREGLDRESTAGGWVACLTRKSAEVDGQVYDLAITWHDRDGDPWEYTGEDDASGEPLMRLIGLSSDDYALPDLVREHGPLKPA